MSADPKDLPPFVRFETLAVEDTSRLLENGHYGFKNLEVAYITRPGQRDTVVKEAALWLGDLEKRAADGMIPYSWPQAFREAFRRWKAGEEIPVDGTPIKGWPVLFPAQQQELLQLNIRSVEELAAAPEEVLGRIGMGAVDLRRKARNWLATAQNVGKVASQVTQLQAENANLLRQLAELQEAVAALKKQAPAGATF